MIDSWAEIDARFNAIKDHRPKAPKKLDELSELLASAYKLDPEKASGMWAYLVNLNVTEDIKNAKFYVAQLFYRLSDHLGADELVDLLMREPVRLRLLILYGYSSGGNLWFCLERFTEGCLRKGCEEACLRAVDLLDEKFSFDANGERGLFLASKAIVDAACCFVRSNSDYAERAENLLRRLNSMTKAGVSDYVRVVLVAEGMEEATDAESLFSMVVDWKMWDKLFPLLWACRDHLPSERFGQIWRSYLDRMTPEDYLPIPSFEGDGPSYEGSRLQYVINSAKHDDKTIDWYFPSNNMLSNHFMHCWAEEDDWGRITRYIAKSVNWERPARRRIFPWDWKRELGWILDAISGKTSPRRGLYGSSEALEGNPGPFFMALAEAALKAEEGPGRRGYIEWLRVHLEEFDEGRTALAQAGLSDNGDSGTPRQRFDDFVRAFLKSGQRELGASQAEYDVLIEALQKDEGFDSRRSLMNAYNDDIVDFYYLHFKVSHEKADMIAACVLAGDEARADHLVDKLLETSTYESFHSRNSWGFGIRVVAGDLIRRFKRERSIGTGFQLVNDNHREVVRRLVEKMIAPLSKKDAAFVKNELLALEPGNARGVSGNTQEKGSC